MRHLKTFSLGSLLLLITVLCIFFAWHARTTSEEKLRLAGSRLVEHALLTTHWMAYETQLQPLIVETAGELSGQPGLSYSYLMPGATADSRGEILDKFELDLLGSLSLSASASVADAGTLRTSAANSSIYYQPVRATANCIICHDGKKGELMAVAKVDLGK